MNSVPWLTIAGAIPLVGAILLAVIPGLPANGAEADRVARDLLAKRLALGFSVLTLIWFIVMAVQFKPSGPDYQFTQTVSWIPEFGVHYAVGVDGIALVLIGMSVVLIPVVMLASWHDAANPTMWPWPSQQPTTRQAPWIWRCTSSRERQRLQ
jgi:NADH-quinone oxidoreductase subunit M